MIPVLCAVVGFVLVLMSLAAVVDSQWVRRLPPLPALLTQAGLNPDRVFKCSVVIAARDEEKSLKQTLDYLLDQRGVSLEVILVDDRSRDGTVAISQAAAAADGRVRVERVEVLPEGWLGKCHACHLGAGLANSEWLLFTDADCWLRPDVVQRAILVAERDGVDHVTLTAGQIPARLDVQAWHLAFLISIASWISKVNRDRPRAFFGIGAFNLVRASAYRECGGYEALRMTVLDDMKLGLLLRRAGKRTRAFIGADDVRCHWGTTALSMVRIMEKNYFAAIDFRTGLAVAATLAGVAFATAPVVGMFTGSLAGYAATLAPFSFCVPAFIFTKRLGWSWRAAALTPFMLPVLVFALLNSFLLTLSQGGIRWRETFYSLETLRRGNVR